MNLHPVKVEFISADQALDLRTRILRPNQAIENCMYKGDHLPSSFHLGVLLDGNDESRTTDKILSNGSFIQEAHAEFPSAKNAYRLRGMATDTQFQKQGLGKLIIESALIELKKRNCDLLWFNARTSAESFYKKFGFVAIENIFEIPLAGPHKLMYKWLMSR